MKKAAVFITGLVLWSRRRQKIKPKTTIVKVNIGAGLSVAPGWMNVDSNAYTIVSKLPDWIIKVLYRVSNLKNRYSSREFLDLLKTHNFIPHDLKYGLPFPDESVDFLYSSHLLEHLFRDDAAGLLKEAYRVLKKGGSIRICVPDLEYAISLYQGGDKTKALSYFFSAANFNERFDNHKYMYDFDLLKSLLMEAGFAGIERCSYRQGNVPDIDKLDNRPEETLFVESVK